MHSSRTGWFTRLVVCVLLGLTIPAPYRLAEPVGVGPSAASAAVAAVDRIADRLLGQPDCISAAANNPAAPIGGLSARSLNYPFAAAIDSGSGRLYVADTVNHRVLSWPSAAGFRLGQAADLVLGQPNFTTNSAPVTPTASSLNNPIGLAVDGAGNLYVADQFNHRVLFFLNPAANDKSADRVYGQQGSFTTRLSNHGLLNPSATSLNAPRGVAVLGSQWVVIADTGNHRVLVYPTATITATDVFGQPDFVTGDPGLSATEFFDPAAVALQGTTHLYISDFTNNRVLRFDDPFAGDALADQVFGQANFDSGDFNRGGSDPAANSLAFPSGLAVDSLGTLYVADSENYRVLFYENAAALGNGPAATQVLGQPDFTSGDLNHGGLSAASLASTNGVVLDSAGSVYVADSGNHRLLAFDVTARTGCHMRFVPLIRR